MGFQTELPDVISHMSYLSDLHQGYNVRAVFNPTEGWSDFWRAI